MDNEFKPRPLSASYLKTRLESKLLMEDIKHKEEWQNYFARRYSIERDHDGSSEQSPD